MTISDAVLVAAGRGLKPYPSWDTVDKMLHPMIDRDGVAKPLLEIQCADFFAAGISRVIMVVAPGEEAEYRRHLGALARFLRSGSPTAASEPQRAEALEHLLSALHFVEQSEALGIGHALYCARDALRGDHLLLSFSDHLLMAHSGRSMSADLLAIHQRLGGAVSSVEDLPEFMLKRYGAVGAQPIAGEDGCWRVQAIAEKPSPTQAELHLESPGLRRGRYLCLTGIHILPTTVFQALKAQLASDQPGKGSLLPILQGLVAEEAYLVAQLAGRHQDIGTKYGLLEAQLERALASPDRGPILTRLAELLARDGLAGNGA